MLHLHPHSFSGDGVRGYRLRVPLPADIRHLRRRRGKAGWKGRPTPRSDTSRNSERGLNQSVKV